MKYYFVDVDEIRDSHGNREFELYPGIFRFHLGEKKPISFYLTESRNPFKMDFNRVKDLRFRLIKESFNYHYSNNSLYRGLCESYNVNPDSIKNYESMLYIPLIPSDFFKELSLSDNPEDIQKIASVPKEQIVTYFTTSGSTGKPSKYPFDRESLERVIKSPKKIFTNVVDIKEDDYILMLSPPPDKSSTGLVQGMYRCMKSMLKTDEQIGFGIKGGALDEEYIINMIYAAKGRRRHLYGPPFIYNSLSDYILQKGHEVKLDKGSNVLITGGWKRVQGEINKAELYEKIGRAFGIDQKNIRDGLGLTDIFSILMECKDHNKHVPPWMYVSIRNTTDLAKEAELGEPGLISFMNPLIQSYPPFIITGDMGRKTYEEKCSCGMIGPTIEYLRRADGLAARGCAIVLDAAINAMRTTK